MTDLLSVPRLGPTLISIKYVSAFISDQWENVTEIHMRGIIISFMSLSLCPGPRWRSWLRHCATSQKVAGSIPDGVIGIFL